MFATGEDVQFLAVYVHMLASFPVPRPAFRRCLVSSDGKLGVGLGTRLFTCHIIYGKHFPPILTCQFNKPKLAETALLFCRVTDVPILPVLLPRVPVPSCFPSPSHGIISGGNSPPSNN